MSASKYPRYESYKDSGVEWLSQVPAHWQVLALGRVLKDPITDGPHSTPVFCSEGFPFLSVDGIQDGELVFDGCRFVSPEDFTEFTRKAAPRRDDILMGKAASVGKIARVKTDQAFSIWSPLALIRVSEKFCSPTFIEYALKSSWLQAQITTLANSNTQMNIGMKDIPKLRITLPPLQEQKKISAFLDRETAKIDNLIAKQERLIELLTEKRSAVTCKLVYGGVNPLAEFSESELPCAERIPKHWNVVALKRIVSLRSGESITFENISIEGDYPVFGGNGLRGFTSAYTHDGHHVLIGRQGALCGNINYASGKFWASEHAVVATPKISIDTTWLGELLRAMNLGQYSVSAAQPGLAVERIANLRIPLPPHTEQIAIATELSREFGKIDLLVQKSGRAIDLLREHRASLISAAVTGKIDVRGLA